MDTSVEESGETRPPEEVLGDQSNAVVAIVIKLKSLSFVHYSPNQPLTRHGDYDSLKLRRNQRSKWVELFNRNDGSDAQQV